MFDICITWIVNLLDITQKKDKMKQFRLFISVLVCLLIVKCAPQTEVALSNEEKESIKREVNQAIDNWMNLPKTDWLDHMLLGMHLNDDFVMVSDGKIIKGEESMSKFVVESMQYIDYIANVQTPERYLNVISRDVVIISLKFTEDVHLKSGDVLTAKGGFQYVYKKIEDEWKVVGMAGAHIE